jgi:hypothetical protein
MAFIVLLLSCLQQYERVCPLLRCDFRCACHVVSEPLFAGHRLIGRFVVWWLVLAGVARMGLTSLDLRSRLRSVIVHVHVHGACVPHTRRREDRGRGRVDAACGYEPSPWRGHWPRRGGRPGGRGERGRAGGRPGPGPATRQVPRPVCAARPAWACSRSL